MKLSRFLLVLLLLFVGMSSVQAMPVTYIADGEFDDGGTLGGSFVFDISSGMITTSSIITSMREEFGVTYRDPPRTQNMTRTSGPFAIFELGTPSRDILNILTLEFELPLTGMLGEVIGISTPPGFGSNELYLAGFRDEEPRRLVTQGTVSTIPIPISATIWLLGTGLLGMFVMSVWTKRKVLA